MHKERLNLFEKMYGGKKKAADAIGVTIRRWDQMKQFDNVTKTVKILISLLMKRGTK